MNDCWTVANMLRKSRLLFPFLQLGEAGGLYHVTVASAAISFLLSAPALYFGPACPVLADSGLVEAGEFGSWGRSPAAQDAGADNSVSADNSDRSDKGLPPSRGSFFGQPLSGQVSVMDHVRGAST